MKLIGLVFFTVIASISSAQNQDVASTDDDQCEVCSDFIDFMVDDDWSKSLPNQFIELLIFKNFQETCMAGCGFTNDLKAEFEYDEVTYENSIPSLIKLAGCETCQKILNETAFYSHGFDFSSIKYSLRHVCEHIKGIMDTVKCKLFIKLRESKILHAIYKYKKNARQACVNLEQC